MNYFQDFFWVLNHSAGNFLAGLIYIVIGFLIGYIAWAKYARSISELEEEGKELSAQLKKNKSEPPSYKPNKSSLAATSPLKDILIPAEKKVDLHPKQPASLISGILAAPQKPVSLPERIIAPPEKAVDLPETIIAPPKKVVDLPEKVIAPPEKVVDIPETIIAPPEKVVDIPEKVIAPPEKVAFEAEKDKLYPDQDFGETYRVRPSNDDDLSQLDGVDQGKAFQLNKRGIYTYKQLDAMGDDHRENLAKDFDLPDINWNSWKTKFALGTVGTGIAGIAAKNISESAPLPEVEPIPVPEIDPASEETTDSNRHHHVHDNELGPVYTSRPDYADNLTQLNQVDDDIAERLNDSGIYTFEQLDSMDGSQRANLTSRFNYKGVNWAAWKTELASDTLAIGPDGFDTEPDNAPEPSLYPREPLEDPRDLLIKIRHHHSASNELGPVYNVRPHFADDLTKLRGIDTVAAARLNSNGIYTFEQLKTMNGKQRTYLTTSLGLPNIKWGEL